jgi:hypothetical protein
LTEKERQRGAFSTVCHYILNNPVRADLVKQPGEWLFNGLIIPGYPALHPLDSDFWQKFWNLYCQAKDPDAGKIRRRAIF